jgi:hypothetical protein
MAAELGFQLRHKALQAHGARQAGCQIGQTYLPQLTDQGDIDLINGYLNPSS